MRRAGVWVIWGEDAARGVAGRDARIPTRERLVAMHGVQAVPDRQRSNEFTEPANAGDIAKFMTGCLRGADALLHAEHRDHPLMQVVLPFSNRILMHYPHNEPFHAF